MTRYSGSKVIAADFIIPDVVATFGNGANTITATTYTDLPTTSCVAAITNPHPTASLLCRVEFGAWIHATANAIRFCPRVSGSVTIAAGIGLGGPLNYGEIPLTSNSGNPQHHEASAIYTLPVSATPATFTLQAMRDSAAGTQTCSYPVLRITPLYYSL